MMKIIRSTIGLLVLSCMGVQSLPSLGQTPSSSSLIPREVIFGNPEQTSPQISPDGQYLTYLAPDANDILQLWIRTIGQQDDRLLTPRSNQRINQYDWTYDGEHILFAQDNNGNEETRYSLINIKTQAVRPLTPNQGIRAELVDLSPDYPNEVLMAMNLNSPFKHDIYRVNITTGEAILDTENPGNGIDATTDSNFQVRSALVVREDGGTDLGVRDGKDKPWKVLRSWEPNSNGGGITFSQDGRLLYILDNEASNTTQLKEINLWNGQEKILAQDQNYDLSKILVHPKTRQIIAVGVLRDRLEWQVLDPSFEADFQAIQAVTKGDVNIENCDLALTHCITAYSHPQKPVAYYLYSRETQQSTRLFSSHPELENVDLASMQPIEFESRDGLKIHGYLTTPLNTPPQNLPTVLLVHGGPWARDTWGFNPLVQWLANRGYAVLQVNYRGSTGYGKDFLNAGNQEWAGKMHLDLIDGVNWLKAQGIADPKRIAIAGGSYGGYATLVGLTFTPEIFAAGVDIVGPSNLITLLDSIPPYWFAGKPIWDYRLGDTQRDTEFLKSRSPVFFADKIQKPLLIGHGANDPRVKQAESDQIVKTMRQAKKPVEYWVYTNEGHGFSRPENRMHFYAQMERFLAEHLGGRSEPEGEILGHAGQFQ